VLYDCCNGGLQYRVCDTQALQSSPCYDLKDWRYKV